MTSWQEMRNRSYESHVVLPGLFTREECGQIISLCEAHPSVPGMTCNEQGYGVNLAVRKVGTAYMPRSAELSWICERMDREFFRLATHWGFDVRETIEDLKYLVYDAGCHFNTWHVDVGGDYSNLRKISMSVELTDSNEYEGGHLQIFSQEVGHVAGPIVSAGTAIVFPSHQVHRVTPVTRGVRRSIINWISGPPLR